jgi:hypothetical protein
MEASFYIFIFLWFCLILILIFAKNTKFELAIYTVEYFNNNNVRLPSISVRIMT